MRHQQFGLRALLVPKILSGCFHHGTHRNAPLCGTEGTVESAFHASQPKSSTSKISAYESWMCVSEKPGGLFRAAFSAPRTRASVNSVVKTITKSSRDFLFGFCDETPSVGALANANAASRHTTAIHVSVEVFLGCD